MKAVKYALISIFLVGMCSSATVFAQEAGASSENRTDGAATTPTPEATNATADDDVILPYYDNYLKEYRLGPSDVITVEVFGQCPDYCKSGITVPPNARISYPLVPGGVLVAGKTVEQVAAEITKKLNEYIIDPKVTVTLDKAVSTRYSVMGKVTTPGVRVMDRKVSVYEAILDAGGVAKGGDKKRAFIVSYAADGHLKKREVSISDMESGKTAMVYLNPGDQVFVPSKGFGIDSIFDILGKASVVRFLFGSPF
ncbi:MAG: polysaccharide export protein [Acidobacteria bacterium]|nr:polysaccharide export protein [Acidobacteriota bacterium]